MFVMGQASKKFVITPEIGRLLQLDARERAERARQLKEEEAIRAKKAKEEELENRLAGQTKARKAPAKPAPRPKPGTAPPTAGTKAKPAPARASKA